MGDHPKQNWYWTRLDPEERKDMHMVYLGFSTVAGGRLGQGRQTLLKSELYSQATGEGNFPQRPFTPHERFYVDRFELTYRQAQVVQKIMHYLDVDYDPGGEENTSENLARRTFYYDDVLARPITPEHPGQPISITQTERRIATYLQSKKK